MNVVKIVGGLLLASGGGIFLACSRIGIIHRRCLPLSMGRSGERGK